MPKKTRKIQSEKNKDFNGSIKYALEGIRYVIGRERKIKFAFICIAPAVVLGLYFNLSAAEWGVCMLGAVLVVALEMVNTAIEAVVDMVMPDIHPLAKVAKDVAAGAVLLSVIVSVMVALIVFIPRIIAEYALEQI